MSVPTSSALGVKALWLAVALLFSLLVALVAGMLMYSTGVGIATAILSGGGAFSGTMLLLTAVLKVMGAF